MNTNASPLHRRVGSLVLVAVIVLSILGFFAGIRHSPSSDGLLLQTHTESSSPAGEKDLENRTEPTSGNQDSSVSTDVLDTASAVGPRPSPEYSQMRQMETGPTRRWDVSIEKVHTVYDYQRCITCHDPHTLRVGPNQQDKLMSLAERAERRAFNGAPPVIPHAVERLDDASCIACHDEGVRVGELIANRMSHRVLANCVQCHAPPTPNPFRDEDIAVASSFVGLPAPTQAARAFAGAPPVVPHSTWMREKCLSCHGGWNGWPGLEVTHRWRTQCL
ncbi:MAG: hypothetical protein KDA99_24850, partial [Planctomycetales bacterium]|nr:hypothetical protein [Planctomycetales bacterium]